MSEKELGRLASMMWYNSYVPNGSEKTERALYEPIREYLIAAFKGTFGGECYLETTANGTFSETIKKLVRHDIIFSFLRKAASPDLTGFSKPEFFPVSLIDTGDKNVFYAASNLENWDDRELQKIVWKLSFP